MRYDFVAVWLNVWREVNWGVSSRMDMTQRYRPLGKRSLAWIVALDQRGAWHADGWSIFVCICPVVSSFVVSWATAPNA